MADLLLRARSIRRRRLGLDGSMRVALALVEGATARAATAAAGPPMPGVGCHSILGRSWSARSPAKPPRALTAWRALHPPAARRSCKPLAGKREPRAATAPGRLRWIASGLRS